MTENQKTRNIGIDVKAPATACVNDKNCPFHGERVVRGRTLVGKISSAKVKRNATMEIERRVPLPKYERFEKRRTKIMVHNPECISAKEGDTVKVMETRKISKMKCFVIVEKQ
ncbi:30S ribosomal protein S17 [Candidatus Woesearchaeota archaeon]|nr:30S ribosomal protein S17 [Candidatus Woesearchaeota archaeon]